MQALYTNRLSKVYSDGKSGLRSSSFEINERELVVLVGPNGAGKTTTVGTLSTTKPTGGAAQVLGGSTLLVCGYRARDSA